MRGSGLPATLLLGGVMLSGLGHADDLGECMASKLQQADDGMTIGELRLQCQKQLQSGEYVAAAKQEAVVSERLRKDKEHVLEPFTLMSHKPNYILVAAHNFSGYDPEVYRQAYDDPSLDIDNTEAQFQISIKTPLAIGLFDTFDLYAGYTNRSFWQVYNSNISRPFRETNHEPEIWAQFNPNWELWGFTNTTNSIGLVHQSNGRGGDLSRSWNRIYGKVVVENGNLALALKPWFRIPEDDDDDDNPDITDYLGHYELRAAYKWGDHVFSGMSRNNLESGFSKGAVELSWSFPLGDYPYMKGYIQYFNGYGESLIDYDQHTNRIGIGFALTDWL
jgi:phospholipase A1